MALIYQALANPNVRKWQTLDKLYEFPSGLDSLYDRMIKYIDDSVNANPYRRILTTTTIVRRPISLRELITLTEIPKNILKKPEYLEKLIQLCGSFNSSIAGYLLRSPVSKRLSTKQGHAPSFSKHLQLDLPFKNRKCQPRHLFKVA